MRLKTLIENMITPERQAVMDVARTWVGVPWRHQGRTRENGIDCVGLPLLIGMELGYMEEGSVPANYPRRPDSTMVPLFHKYLVRIKPNEEQIGDIVVFADGSHPCHCGILTTRPGIVTVVHAHAHDRRVIEEDINHTIGYIGKPVHAFKFKGLE